MKPLHHGANDGKVGKLRKGQFPRVEHLLQLLGDYVLMLAWPLGKKGTRKPWGHLTAAKMADPAYLQALEAGNIGVALGSKSNGLCSIDWDDDEWMERFLDANPALQTSLRTRGARGCNVWVRALGAGELCDYPNSYTIKTVSGEAVGEWRANGNQTIISGRHPSGCDYSFLVEAKPVEIEFKSIVWPEGLRRRPMDQELPAIAHSAHSALSLTVPSATQSSQVLSSALNVGGRASAGCAAGTVCNEQLFDILPFVPDQRGQTDRLLWAMAGRLRTVERQLQRLATSAEKTALFKAWWPLAEPHVDPDMDAISYHAKWQADCKRRKFCDDETALTAAWRAAQDEPLPIEAAQDYDLPMPEKLRLLIALCWQLQLYHDTSPFFLGSRDAGKLLATPHRTVAYWLDALADEDGPFRILRKVSTGSLADRHTNEWRYLRLTA